MSLDLLLDATRDHLRAALGLSAGECDVTPDGRPHPDAGQRFFAIHGGTASNSSNECLDERFGLTVTVTVRTGDRPADRTRDGGAKALAKKVKDAIHGSYDLLALAEAADENAGVQYVEPLRYESTGELDVKGPDWFWAEGDDEGAITGLAVAVKFGRGRRITLIGEAT